MDGTMLAVLHHALLAARKKQTPTAKPLDIIGIESHDDLAGIVRDGALALKEDRAAGLRNYVIARAVTTEQSQNIIYNESSSVLKALIMTKELRETMEQNFIGEVPVDSAASVEGPGASDLRSVFELKMDEFVSRGFLIGAGEKPAWYRNDYRIIIDADSYYFEDIRGHVSLPINFVFGLLELEALRIAA